jgi:cell division topological specificity factor
MGLFDKLFGRKKPAAPSAGELARERLTLMLVHDRLKLTPDLLNRIKGELLEVISKYVEIDEAGVDVELTHSEHSDKLVARMPVRRQRIQFQRDVLEPGMGNPLAAAAALAQIHQPPAEASAAPAEAAPAAAPQEPAAPASVQESPASPPAEAPAEPASTSAEATLPGAAEAAAPTASVEAKAEAAEAAEVVPPASTPTKG